MRIKIFTTAFFFALGFSLSAQTYCESFDNCFVDPANLTATRNHAFNTYGNGNPGCLQDWEVTNGTPAVYRDVDGFGNAFNGSQFMFLGVDNTTIGEGAALQYNFQAGKSYQITFARKNATAGTQLDIAYVLLQGAIPYTYNTGVGASAFPAIPGNAYVAHSEDNYTNNTWQVLTITTPVLATSYSRIWFRPSSNISQGQAFLLVDSLCIKEVVTTPISNTCTDFEDCLIDATNGTTLNLTRNHTFNTYGNGNAGCLQDWEVTNGTPSIYRDVDGFGAAYTGNQFVFLGVDNNAITEGAAYKYQFQAGQSYRITFARKNAVAGTQLKMDYVLLQNQIPYTYNSSIGASATPAIPGNALVVSTESSLTSNSWQVLTITTPVLTNSYSRFWIRPSWTASTQAQTFFLMDSFCIQPVNCDTNTVAVSINSSNLTCNHLTDTATLNLSGGTPPYTFNWNTGSTSDSIVIQNPGIYTVWVSDSNGCVKSASDTVLNLAINVTLQSSGNVTCNGVSNGKIDVQAAGGTPPYTYAWSNGGTTDSIAGLTTGTYTVTVTDNASCSATFSKQINQTSTNWSYYVSASVAKANCVNNGSATANPSGGTAPYTYLWSTVPAQTTKTAVGLAPGSYTVTVAGSDGCTRTGTANVGSTCKNVVNGFVYFDINGNCVKDTGETVLSGVSITATNGTNTYYGNTNSSGFFNINCANPGTYTVNAVQSGGYSNCPSTNVCGAQSVVFATLGDTASRNFGFAASSGFDLRIQATWNTANPGFAKTYSIRYYQQSQPLYTGAATIMFEYDSILLYQSCTQGGVHDSIRHTITWNVASVPFPTWNTATMPYAYFVVPVTTPISYPLRQEFWISPTQGDCDSLDNHVLTIQPVVGSFDPNEKNVSPAGDIFEEDSVLTYTIHFQNTGNDTTWFIVLKDTLSQHLEPSSAYNLASSHPITSFDISDNGILTWEFDPIYLVDSATNEPASKGFVMFKVKKKPNLPLNTIISNRAGIYFDYNEPIITNTVSTKLTEPNFVFSLSNDANIAVTAVPNPFTLSTVISVDGTNGAFDFELADVNGKLLKKISADGFSSFEIEREGMAAGIYFYAITTKNKQRAFGKLIVQ